jgi:hypothetical protein
MTTSASSRLARVLQGPHCLTPKSEVIFWTISPSPMDRETIFLGAGSQIGNAILRLEKPLRLRRDVEEVRFGHGGCFKVGSSSSEALERVAPPRNSC